MPIDMVQRFVVEVDSANFLKQYLRLAITTTLNSYEELAVKVVDCNEKDLILHLPSDLMDQDKHFPVIFIGGWYLPKEGEKNSYFNGYGSWTMFHSDRTTNAVDAAIGYIEELFEKQGKTWNAQFKQKFGDGYDDFLTTLTALLDLATNFVPAGVSQSGWLSPSSTCITASDFTNQGRRYPTESLWSAACFIL